MVLSFHFSGPSHGSPRKEKIMNWDQIEGRWKQYMGDVKRQWGKLTDDDLTTISGHKDKLIGTLQERYGYSKEQADREVNTFTESLREPMKM
jgi:uncharacterized protein YjbJ (UPF0337 family)